MNFRANCFFIYESRRAKPGTIWILFIFIGFSYGSLDKIGFQFLYYLTLGGFGFWALIRLFTLSGAIKDYNRKIAAEIGMDKSEMAKVGLF